MAETFACLNNRAFDYQRHEQISCRNSIEPTTGITDPAGDGDTGAAEGPERWRLEPVNGSLYDGDAVGGAVANSFDIYLEPPVKGSEYADVEDTVEAEGRCRDAPISSRTSMKGRVLSIQSGAHLYRDPRGCHFHLDLPHPHFSR